MKVYQDYKVIINHMPRKEYKTITVKTGTFQKFLKTIQEAKKSDTKLDNSKFVEMLLEKYKKSR